MSVSRRSATVAAAIDSASPASGVLFTDLSDIRWLTGFSGSNGWLLFRPDRQVLLTDGRYGEQAAEQAARTGSPVEIVVCANGAAMSKSLAVLLRRGDRIWFQSANLTVSTFTALRAALPEGVELTPSPSSLADIRRIKDADEIALIERACRIADEALAGSLELIVPGCTERELRDELEYRLRRCGADGPSYDTIVATGPTNSALPHHRPDSTPIEEGHSLVIDVGALVDGYHSDMTRTFLIGDVPKELADFHDVVLESHLAGISEVRAGVTTKRIHETCRAVFEREGVADLFVHGTGHGVGLVIHEEPFLNSSSSSVLQVGDVVTVEPGLYRVRAGGVRIEDLVLVTESGCRSLNTSPKEATCPPSPRTI